MQFVVVVRVALFALSHPWDEWVLLTCMVFISGSSILLKS